MAHRVAFPPAHPVPEFVVILREPFDKEEMTVVYPDAASYDLSHEEVERLLRNMGCWEPEQVVTDVLNFNRVVWWSKDNRHIPVFDDDKATLEQLVKTAKQVPYQPA
jgi:hypothetical protein